MIVTIEPAQNKFFKEDVNSTTGELAIGGAHVVYDMTFTSDAGSVGNFGVFDTTTAAGMTTANKVVDVRLGTGAAAVQQLTFPRGKRFSNGIWIKTNIAGLDFSMDYD